MRAALLALFLTSAGIVAGVSGSRTYYLTGGPGCAGGFELREGTGAGQHDVALPAGASVNFCSRLSPDITRVAGHFRFELVFREPHPLPNGTLTLAPADSGGASVDNVCVPEVDAFDVSVAVLGADGSKLGSSEKPAVPACALYRAPVFVEIDPLRAEPERPLFTTGVVELPDMAVAVPPGARLVLQVTHLAVGTTDLSTAHLVVTPENPVYKKSFSPSVLVGPPEDPCYPDC